VISYRDEIPLPTIYGKQIRNHLPSYRKRRPIGIALLLFFLVDQSEFRVLSRR